MNAISIAQLKRFCLLLPLLLCSCSSLFFFPMQAWQSTPDQHGMAYRDVALQAEDGTLLSAWLLEAETPRAAVLYLHGNAENISTHFYNVKWMPEAGFDVLMLDYRGFGKSGGSPTLPEVFMDIDAASQWLERHYDASTPVIVFGQSIGASLSFYWLADAHRRGEDLSQIKAVVLDSPFASYRNMVRHVLGNGKISSLFAWPVSRFFSDRYSPLLVAEDFPDKPLLFFNSKQDQVVPFSESQALYEKIPGNKQRAHYQGMHISVFRAAEQRQNFVDFVSAYE